MIKNVLGINSLAKSSLEGLRMAHFYGINRQRVSKIGYNGYMARRAPSTIPNYFRCVQCLEYYPIEYRARLYCSRSCRDRAYYISKGQARYKQRGGA